MMRNFRAILLAALLTTLGVVFSIPPTLAQEFRGIELNRGERRLSASGGYARLVDELDAATQESSAEIIEIADGLCEELTARLAELKRSEAAIGNKLRPHEVLNVVQTLGECSARLAAAEQWANFSLRDERLRHYAARREVKARNAAELRRAYAEYQNQLVARQFAAHQLWQLASGRARVVATTTYSGGFSTVRRATPAETMQFAGQLRANAYARINVRPPEKTQLVGIYDIQRLAARAEQQTAIMKLSSLVDAELKHLAPKHLEQVHRLMNDGSEAEQAKAIMSLGWWNGLEGRRMLDKSLASESESIRDAGLAAIGRWRHSSLTIAAFANHPRPEVRLEAACLASQQVQNIPRALKAIRDLFSDDSETVRVQAYRTLDQLGGIGNLNAKARFCYIGLPLKSTSTTVVLDAVHWLVDCGDNSDQALVQAKMFLLLPLKGHFDNTVRAAAGNACNAICMAKN